jgi:CDP-glucose 4,6-dehydratase
MISGLKGTYEAKRIFITGHSGFKGSWLSACLEAFGGRLTGYALDPPSQPNHFDLLDLGMESIVADIRDRATLAASIAESRPDIVFHLAAQPLVRHSYLNPAETFETNVLGTVNLLEACRACSSVKAVIIVTSDKCYENREWRRGYREGDRLGGYDPYSCSKACAELVTDSFRNSFFPLEGYGKEHRVLVASARAGNVIGGGDWGEDRLIPDIVRSAVSGTPAVIRNPESVRPWQHVLDLLSGYLMLGQRLLEGRLEFADAWNFGPESRWSLSVLDVVRCIQQHWDAVSYNCDEVHGHPHETNVLVLDSSKSERILEWRPAFDTRRSIEKTVDWYRSFYDRGQVITHDQISQYFSSRPDAAGPSRD